ncbi:hypothetical protein EV702DRAFT_1193804 [Suillus placidus]|uniref:Uncharacterized protein n=1 Tax=Suillus placidus TaxID=48579 RepID=A0A9P7A209_9AGAM|nr:hypothetical protein EV702DRAFT_1193804 [Suillus placidus]
MDQDGLGTGGSLKREFLMENNPSFEPSPFFHACHPILEEWCQAIRDALKDERDLSHDEIVFTPSPPTAMQLPRCSTRNNQIVSSSLVPPPTPAHSGPLPSTSGPSVALSSFVLLPPPSPPVLSNRLCHSLRKKKHPSST